MAIPLGDGSIVTRGHSASGSGFRHYQAAQQPADIGLWLRVQPELGGVALPGSLQTLAVILDGRFKLQISGRGEFPTLLDLPPVPNPRRGRRRRRSSCRLRAEEESAKDGELHYGVSIFRRKGFRRQLCVGSTCSVNAPRVIFHVYVCFIFLTPFSHDCMSGLQSE